MNTTALIRGVGFHVPEKVLTNADLERMVETSDQWITTRTGIKERRIAAPGQAASDLALPASLMALAAAGIAPAELTHIVVPTVTPDTYSPSAACFLAHKLGVRGIAVMDINAGCSGFVYGLEVARALLCLHPAAKVLVVAGEVLTSRTNWADRATCVLFGDGAGAVVVTSGDPRPGPGDGRTAVIEDVLVAADGELAGVLGIKGGGSGTPYRLGDVIRDDFFIQMQGQEVFKQAVRRMESVALDILGRNGLTPADIALFIPHQANMRIIDALGRKLGARPGQIFANVDRYGNTSAASVGIGLAEALSQGRIRPGQRAMIVTFGAGFTWAAALLRF